MNLDSPGLDQAPKPESARKRVLIVCPAFPPISAPDGQRVRMSLSYYRENGWDPVVLTVDPARQAGTREEALLETFPPDIPVYQCAALPRSFGLGSIGLRAWVHLLIAGGRLIRQEGIDLVFFSTTQFILFPLGRIWRRRFGVPYVIDLQDPWRTDYYERRGGRRPPGGWKYQFARLQAWLLEEWSYRRANGFISVSAQYLIDLRRRYVWFSAVPSEVLQFGASEADLAAARKLPGPAAEGGAASPVRIVYTGVAGTVMLPAVTLLFEAVRRLRARNASAASKLRFEFVGTSYAPAPNATSSVLPVAEGMGVAEGVLEQPARIGHLETLRVQADADVLLLLGTCDPGYSPSKLYPYYLTGRPMLSLVFRNGTAETILRELNCSCLITFEETTGAAQSVEALVAALERAAERDFSAFAPARNDALFQREYLARTLTTKQAAVFDAALRLHHARRRA